jgi:hypothetical protein
MCFRWQFLYKLWPINSAHFFSLYLGYLYPPWLYVILHFAHDKTNRSSPSFPSTTLQNFPGMADLLFEMSKFQHHKKLCSKCSTSLVSSFNLNLIGWWRSLLAERLLCLGNHRFSFTCTACIFVIMLPKYIQYSSFYNRPFSRISGDNKSKFILDWIITTACLIVCIPTPL